MPQVPSRIRNTRKKVPRIPKEARTQGPPPEFESAAAQGAVAAVRETTHEKFRDIPSTPAQKKRARLRQNLKVKPKKTAEAPPSPENEEKRQKEDREKAHKDANTPAEEIHSEQVRKAEEKILGKFRKHPITLLRKYVLAFIVVAILLFILSAFFRTSYPAVFTWGFWGVMLIAATFLADMFIRWSLNISILTKERVISLEHDGVFNHTIEIVPMTSVRYLELKQEGPLKTLLNYGDIHITSFISEVNQDTTLTDISNVKKAFTILQKKAYAINKQP